MNATLNRSIGKVVEHYLLHNDESRAELAEVLHVHLRTLHRRITGQLPWTAEEVAMLAEHFGVPVTRFYEGTNALMGPRTIDVRESTRPVTHVMGGRDDAIGTAGNRTVAGITSPGVAAIDTAGNHTLRPVAIAGGRQPARTALKPGLARHGLHTKAAA